MASIPFAFSVHHFVSSVGADAGFAAIIGLAILVLLYFAQARETATLRKQAEDAADHVQQLELQVAHLSRGGVGTGTMPATPAPAPPGIARPTAAPVPAIAAARSGAAAPVAARAIAPVGAGFAASSPTGIPAAPAGVGAPALSSATRLIPISETDSVSAHTNGQTTGSAAVAPAAPAPATAAGGANGASNARGGATIPPPAAPPRPAARPGAARPASGRPTAPPRRPGPAAGRGGPSSGGSRVTRGFIILLSLLGIVAVVVVLLIVTSSGGSSSQSSSSAAQNARTAATRRARNRRAAVTPASVTVAVLNGTSIANLAHDVGQRLQAAGFKEGNLATAADQTQTATVVGYLPGHKAGALLVAKSLKLGPASVQPVDQSNRTVACPGSAPCAAKVVVTVGSDLASTQTQ